MPDSFPNTIYRPFEIFKPEHRIRKFRQSVNIRIMLTPVLMFTIHTILVLYRVYLFFEKKSIKKIKNNIILNIHLI